MLQYPAADDGVETAGRVGQSGKIGGHLRDAVGAEPIASALEHTLGIIESGEEGVGIGLAQEESRIAAIAAAGVENALAALDVEAAGANKPTGESFVARQ